MKTILFVLWLSLWAVTGCQPMASISSPPPAIVGNAARGKALFQQTLIGSKNVLGCINCHSSTAGMILVGPSLAGIGDQAETIIRQANYTGQAQHAADYLRESIINPNAYIEEGFQPNVMRATYAQELSPQEIEDLVTFLLALK